MSNMIQIRNVPDQLHRTLKSRAANAGMSLSGYIKKELEKSAEQLTMKEWLEIVSRNRPIRVKPVAADLIEIHAEAESFIALHLLDVEVTPAGANRARQPSSSVLRPHPFSSPHLGAPPHFATYDAAYSALAEAFGATL